MNRTHSMFKSLFSSAPLGSFSPSLPPSLRQPFSEPQNKQELKFTSEQQKKKKEKNQTF